MNRPVIHVEGVGVRIADTAVLSDVSWRVDPGQQWAILGANGSGKTTLLNVITGYQWASEGSVRVLGNLFGHVDLRELRKRIGYVGSHLATRIRRRQTARQIVLSGAFASTALFDTITGAQNQRAHQLIDRLDLVEHAEQLFGTLSAGEQQRALIARALMPAPDLLLIDEPCAGLDLPGRETLLGTVDALARGEGEQSTTLVMVTHHIEEITARFSHVLILAGGRVLAAGPKPEVLTQQTLTNAFGLTVELDVRHGRYWPRIPGGQAAP